MHALHIVCRCGHSAEVPWPSPSGFRRDEVLARARCTRCGGKSATDVRLLWIAEGDALEGAWDRPKGFDSGVTEATVDGERVSAV